MNEEHKWLRSVSLLDIVDLHSLQQVHKVIKNSASKEVSNLITTPLLNIPCIL